MFSAEPQHINIFPKEKGKKESLFIREGFPKSKFVEKNTTRMGGDFFPHPQGLNLSF